MAPSSMPLSLRLLGLYPKKLGSAVVGVGARWKLSSAQRTKLLGRFAAAYGVNLEEAEKPLEEYTSFLDFFTRRLKPGIRPQALLGPGGRSLGRLEITLQDFIGYVKLLHKINHVDVLVRGTAGHLHTSLAGAARRALPTSGCVQVGARRYVVRTLMEAGFAGEPVVISLLTPA